jgi:peptide/nickel transport system permease protein
MGTYIVRRLIVAVPTLLGITVLVFFFLTLVPGFAPPFVPPEIAGVDKPFGLDLGLPIAYLAWIADAIQGNFGYATIGGFLALEYVSRGALASATLVGTALALGIVVGIPLGVVSALRPHSKLDVILTTVAYFGLSTPTFLLGLGGLWLLGLQLRLVPIGGMQSPSVPFELPDFLRHLALPAMVLGIGYVAMLMRYTRSAVLEVIGAMYVTTAESKGLPRRVVVGRHALRNALVPILTVIGLSLPDLLGGAVITETVFAWPGVGLMMFEAVMRRDYLVVMAVSLFVGIAVIVANLLTDILVGAADPRIRY